MAKSYHAGPGQRVINVLFRRLARWGLGAQYLHVLTVTGRKSGRQRSVPVDVMEVEGERYLVAPCGEVNWVRNLRAAKRATLQRAHDLSSYEALELDPESAIPVIREYVRSVPVTRRYWDIDEHASDADVRKEAQRHPVFRLSHRLT